MFFFRNIFEIAIEAIFPLSKAEKELFLLSSEQAFSILPRSPEVPIPSASAIFAYKDERVRKMVWNIKYKRSEKAVGMAAFALHKKIKERGNAIIIPMPITPRRRRERGYNQCEFMALKLMELENADRNSSGNSGHLNLEKDLLTRTQHKSRQTLKSREERLKDAKGIFGIDEAKCREIRSKQTEALSKGKMLPIIVLDDVITTGSTMKEAMETLRRAGFVDVKGLSLAH